MKTSHQLRNNSSNSTLKEKYYKYEIFIFYLIIIIHCSEQNLDNKLWIFLIFVAQ